MISDTVLIAIVAAVPATVSAILGLLNRTRLGCVHEIVNGQREEMRQQLNRALDEIVALKETAIKLEVAAKLRKK